MSVLLLLSLAFANDLIFSQMSMNADNGVTLSYTLDAAAFEECARQLRSTGDAPNLIVTVESGGMKKTQYVQLREQSRTVSIASGSWPKGLTATVELRPDEVFDQLNTPRGTGKRVRVEVDGGQDRADPTGMGHSGPSPSPSPRPPSSGGGGPAPVSRPPPVQVDPMAVANAAFELQRRIAEERARQAAQEAYAARMAAEQAALNAIAQDPNHPITAACTEVYGSPEDGKCIVWAAYRLDGAAEVRACGRLAHAGMREDCRKLMQKVTFAGAPTMTACADAFDTDKGAFQCFDRAREAETPPVSDIADCAAGFESTPDRFGCMARFSTLTWSPSRVIPACKEHFPNSVMTCVHKLSAGVDAPLPDLAASCAGVFADAEELGHECLAMMRKRSGDPAGAVEACASVYASSKDRLACVELARRDPNPERIAACASIEKKGPKKRCVEGN